MFKFKAGFLYVVLLAVAGCASLEKPSPTLPKQQVPVVQETPGETVARHLETRYLDTSANCGSPSEPAFLCSGIMLRVTRSDPSYHVWENSDSSIAKGGVSFSYLRKDTRFTKLAFGGANGYIMNAYYFASSKPLQPEVLCIFPIDAFTVSRDDKGCGAHVNFPDSKACQSQGITTAQQWWTHYDSHTSQRHEKQCGFDVKDSLDEMAGPAFAAGIAAMSYVEGEPVDTQNEIILAAWNDGAGPSLPLEAFFYLVGSQAGLTEARYNQKDLKDTHGIIIPIIRLKLPDTPTSEASFTYDPADQTEPVLAGQPNKSNQRELVN